MVMDSQQAERTWISVHENEAQSPWKKTGGAANLQFSQKFSISRVCKKKLGCICVLSFLENAKNVGRVALMLEWSKYRVRTLLSFSNFMTFRDLFHDFFQFFITYMDF